MSNDFRQTAELFQMEVELHLLQVDRRNYLSNPLIGYLNIISVLNKIADLWIIIQNLPLGYLVLSETKLDKYGPNEIEIKIDMVFLSILAGDYL